jgi:hypothetical protein
MRGSQEPKAIGWRKKTSMVRRWGERKDMGLLNVFVPAQPRRATMRFSLPIMGRVGVGR